MAIRTDVFAMANAWCTSCDEDKADLCSNTSDINGVRQKATRHAERFDHIVEFQLIRCSTYIKSGE